MGAIFCRLDDSTHILFSLQNAVQVIVMRNIDVRFALCAAMERVIPVSHITLVIYLTRTIDLFRLTALFLRTGLDK
jgi:hypothetical protein